MAAFCDALGGPVQVAGSLAQQCTDSGFNLVGIWLVSLEGQMVLV